MKKIRVKFLIHPNHDEVFAMFPDEDWDFEGNKTSYAKVGQHGACSLMYAKECRDAKEEEYLHLLNELKNIGYKNIKII